ncbi:MAG: UDP-N-acetylmuramate--L-alanine ligase [Ignavibacteria bacterium]|jgi:UDP-N-acetylmuramate--alanine ligase|nr:UDP-N-acetylmuramate--L-alanine ligase [Ignavibacteria bacterium]MDH7527381.1 UDP-N-acetylmuramate--L-alanine ligase [Ignavibacteria bacterium]
MLRNFRKVHMIGIGGIGMSGIAEVLLAMNFKVSGSDRSLSEITDRLASLGAEIYEGHRAENLKDADVVVYSSAVTMDNVEIQEALKRKIPVIKRSEMLAELMRLKYGIGIAGTHGKTTTTSMVGLVMLEAGFDPTVIVGGKLSGLGGTNARLGKGEFIVVEADEFDRSFLQLTPVIAAITTLEKEHLDIYKDLDDIKAAFVEFANKVPFYGFVVLCLDEEGLREILPQINRKVITYGLSAQADIRAYDISFFETYSKFKVRYKGETLGEIELNVPGIHNVKNSLVAVTIAKELGVDFETIKLALKKFTGVYRRFEIKADINNILVIDDYAHHPTEVAATLSAIRTGWDRRVVAVFQPHLYTRTRDFYQDFAKAFLDSDVFICTDVYPAREIPIQGISGKLITDAAEKFGHKNVIYIPDKKEIPDRLLQIVEPGDVVVTMGAGDIWKFGEEFINKLKSNS